MTEGKRPLWIVVGLLGLAAAALWTTSAITWIELPTGTVFEGELRDELSGADLAAWFAPLALFALAAVAAALALRGRARWVLGVVLLAVAAWVAYLVSSGAPYDVDLSQRAAGYGPASGSPTRAVWGPVTAIAGALLMAAAGALLLWRGHRMPRMGAKYSAPGDDRERPTARDSEADLWNSLSEGDDPTTRDR